MKGQAGGGRLTVIQTKMVGLFGQFCDLNISVKEIFHQLSEENMIKDQANWFEPKADGFKDFAEKAEAWIKEAQLCIAYAKEALHRLFGNIKDFSTKAQLKFKWMRGCI